MADNYHNWFDGNNFEKFLAIIDSNKFNYQNKMGVFKYINIKNLANNIRINTISEISAKKGLNTLNEIKDAEITKYKKRSPKHKELLNLFNDLLHTILTDKTLMSSKDENEKENENENENESENENEKENNKTLLLSKDENEKQNRLLNANAKCKCKK